MVESRRNDRWRLRLVIVYVWIAVTVGLIVLWLELVANAQDHSASCPPFAQSHQAATMPTLVIWYAPNDPDWQAVKPHVLEGAPLKARIDQVYELRFRNCAEPLQSREAGRQRIHRLTFAVQGVGRLEGYAGFRRLCVLLGYPDGTPPPYQSQEPRDQGQEPLAPPDRPNRDTDAPDAPSQADPAVPAEEPRISPAARQLINQQVDVRIQGIALEVNAAVKTFDARLDEWQSLADQQTQQIAQLRAQIDQLREKCAAAEKEQFSSGPPGRAGKDGVNGQPGKDGINGRPGKDGRDGAFVSSAQISSGRLILILSDGREIDAGPLPGADLSPVAARLDSLEQEIARPFDVQLFSQGKPVTEVRSVQPHGGWLPIDLPWSVAPATKE